MARGKYLSLEEARKMKHGLTRFARETIDAGKPLQPGYRAGFRLSPE